MPIFTEEQRAELAEVAYKRQPVHPGKPYTEAHLREVMLDAQMRLAGASWFGHALTKAGVWDEQTRRNFEHEMDNLIGQLQDIYSELD